MNTAQTIAHRRVVVVGAGPAGSATALRLAQNGIEDVVLVDAHDFPRHKTCGSALSPRGIAMTKELGVWEQIKPLAYPLVGLRVVTPGGKDVVMRPDTSPEEAEAVICQRRFMDHEIHKAALRAGVQFLPNFFGSEPVLHGDRWAGIRARDGREVHADWTVIANGAHTKFAVSEAPKRMIHAIMGWWNNVEFEPHTVEMIWDRMLEPYYGWLFPESDERVNIGITYQDDHKTINARALFRQFLDKYYADRLEGAEQIGKFKGHPILYAYKLGRLWSPGRIVVGEAGRMTHPATGEGIYHGLRSGSWAADALRDILHRNIPTGLALRAYEAKCSATFVPSFWGGRLFRRAAKTPVLDWAVGLTESPRLQDTFRRILGHM